MKLTKKEEAEIRQLLDDYWNSYFSGNIDHWSTYLVDDYRNIGGTEEEIWNSKKEILDYTYRIIDQMKGVSEIRNKQVQIIPYDPYVMVHELMDIYIKIENEWAFYQKFRLSSLIQKKNDELKVLHQHGSYPDSKTLEGEAFAFDTLQNENLKLQQAIKTRTIELEQKNRELEIEAATERVRVQSMAMLQPGDLKNVNKELLTQLTKLEIPGLSGVSFYFIDPDEIVTVWDLSSPGNMTYPNSYSFRYDSKKFPILGEFVGILKSTKEDYFVLDFPKDKLLLANEELKHININIANIAKTAIDSGALLHQWNPAARITDGILSIDMMMPPTDDTKTIVLKMAGAFNQAYTRFLDLQKAEEQAREAQIETSLERVRSRSMGMQKSEELKDVIKIVYQQITHLKINCNHAGFVVDYTPKGDWNFWIADQQDIPDKITHPYFDSVWANQFNEAKANGVILFATYLNFEEKNTFYNELLLHVPGLPQTSKDFYLNCPGLAASTVLLEDVGLYIENFLAIPYTDEENNILLRFGKVFQQSYTRFLDLKNAEAQALRAEQDLIAIKEARKKAEEALIELQFTQKQLIQSEKMASLGELTAGIAHEIQNPLNFVNNFSEVSSELISEMVEEFDKGNFDEVKAIADDVKQNLEKINHHGQRAADIVKGMLQHSRSSSGVKEPTDINALADEYLRLAYHGLRAKDKTFNVTMKTEYDESIGKVNIIPQDIGRVVLNLITNAFYVVNEKAKTPQPPKGEGGQPSENYEPTVWVTTKLISPPSGGSGVMGRSIQIKVSDNGGGIPPKILDKIFQPFFTTKPTGQGTGLGLSLSYDIVKAHGGELKVETKEGEGSEFIIQIPA